MNQLSTMISSCLLFLITSCLQFGENPSGVHRADGVHRVRRGWPAGASPPFIIVAVPGNCRVQVLVGGLLELPALCLRLLPCVLVQFLLLLELLYVVADRDAKGFGFGAVLLAPLGRPSHHLVVFVVDILSCVSDKSAATTETKGVLSIFLKP